jgi:predicted enzyme related to lactoylglutathione lyase
VAALVRADGTVLQPPVDLDKIGRIAVVQDPQGAVFSVAAPTG